MSASEVVRFVEDMKTHAELAEIVTEGAGSLPKIVELAAAKGYTFTVEEANEFLAGAQGAELQDAQLDAVAGGKHHPPTTSTAAVQTTTVVTTAAAAAEGVAVVVVATAVVVT